MQALNNCTHLGADYFCIPLINPTKQIRKYVALMTWSSLLNHYDAPIRSNPFYFCSNVSACFLDNLQKST